MWHARAILQTLKKSDVSRKTLSKEGRHFVMKFIREWENKKIVYKKERFTTVHYERKWKP